jgi:hypothetical protein
MDDIVAARIGSTITNSIPVIKDALERNQDIEWLSRRRMALMDAFDLGPRWHKLATSKTIFQVDDDGNPILPGDTP